MTGAFNGSRFSWGGLKGLLSTSTGSRFRQNFLKVARANLIALALPILVMPILTRLFTASDYGALALFTSALALLTAFCTWRFDWALPNAKTTTMAASIFAVGLIILVGACVVVGVAIPFIKLFVPADTSLGRLGNLLFLLPVALAGSGLMLMFSGWYVRQGDLTAVSHGTIAQSATNVLVALATGMAKLGALGLIAATITAVWANIAVLVRQGGQTLLNALRRVTRRSLRAAVRKHGGNATWSTMVAIVNALSFNAPVLVFAALYPASEVGWYALMYRLVATPTSVLASALGRSFWTQAAEHARARDYAVLNRLYRRTTLHLGFACIPIIGICLAGPFFVGPLLGAKEWGGAGYVLMAMAPLFVGSILFSPTNHLVVLDMQHTQLWVDSARLILVVASIVAASYLGLGFVVGVALASLSSLVGHLLLFFIHLRAHRHHELR